MLTTVHIPAYSAGRSGPDFPSRTVDMRFEGYPPKGLQIVTRGQDEDGRWDMGIVEVVSVRVDPGWKLPSNVVMDDNRDSGYIDVQVFTSWVDRPGRPVSRGR